MGRRFVSFLLFLLLIIILLLGGYFLNGDDNVEVITIEETNVLQPLIVEGNSKYVNGFDDYVDPLDKEISELDYKDEISNSKGSDDEGSCVEVVECRDDFSEAPYCIGDRVYERTHKFSCDGTCDEDVRRVLVEDCLIGCFEGVCVDSYPFDCEFDFDCNFDDFVGDTYCLPDDNVHQYYANWTCLNPGSPDSMCHVELEDKLVDECGTGVSCDGGMCVTSVR